MVVGRALVAITGCGNTRSGAPRRRKGVSGSDEVVHAPLHACWFERRNLLPIILYVLGRLVAVLGAHRHHTPLVPPRLRQTGT